MKVAASVAGGTGMVGVLRTGLTEPAQTGPFAWTSFGRPPLAHYQGAALLLPKEPLIVEPLPKPGQSAGGDPVRECRSVARTRVDMKVGLHARLLEQ